MNAAAQGAVVITASRHKFSGATPCGGARDSHGGATRIEEWGSMIVRIPVPALVSWTFFVNNEISTQRGIYIYRYATGSVSAHVGCRRGIMG